MKWHEFKALLTGISPDTALGRIVSIRAETNEEAIKTFTPEMKKIHSEWQLKLAKEKTPEQTAAFLESIKNMLIGMAGGEENRKN